MFYIQINVYIFLYFNCKIFSDDLTLISFVLHIFLLKVSIFA